MDFASGGTEKAPSFKSIAEDSKLETELDKRQQEWEKVKTAEVEDNEGLPLDRRPLWMKLQEQKDKKQAEWEEKHDPKAMVQGLEEEEAEFLNKCADYQTRIKNDQRREEQREMREFREAAMQTPHTDPDAQVRDNLFNSATAQAKKKPAKSPISLMAGLVKTKRKRSSDGEPPSKSTRRSLDSHDAASESTHSSTKDTVKLAATERREDNNAEDAPGASKERIPSPAAAPNGNKPLGLAGLQAYSDESDSDSS